LYPILGKWWEGKGRVSFDGLGGIPHQGGRGREKELLPTHVWYDTCFLCTDRNDSAMMHIYIHMRSVLNLMLPDDFVSFIMFMHLMCVPSLLGMMYLTLQCANEKQMMEWASTMYHAISIANGGAYIIQYERDRMQAEMEVTMITVNQIFTNFYCDDDTGKNDYLITITEMVNTVLSW
jgi:hypothetical protein